MGSGQSKASQPVLRSALQDITLLNPFGSGSSSALAGDAAGTGSASQPATILSQSLWSTKPALIMLVRRPG